MINLGWWLHVLGVPKFLWPLLLALPGWYALGLIAIVFSAALFVLVFAFDYAVAHVFRR